MRHITHGHFRLYGLLVGLVTVVALAGCSSQGSPDSSGTLSPTGSSPSVTSTSPSVTTSGPAPTTTRPPANGSAKMVQVVMTKTGGISGLNLRLLVQPDSTWIVID